MKHELRNIFPEPERKRSVNEFVEWYEKGVQELQKNPSLFRQEILSSKRDSKNCPTAKRLKEETGALYNLLKDTSFGFRSCFVEPNWGNQPFDVKIDGHKQYKYVEIVSVGAFQEKETENSFKTFGLEVVDPIVHNIEKAIEHKKGKNYGQHYALLVYYNNEQILAKPWREKLCKQLMQKNISHGCFIDIFITGFSMGASVLKLP
ncbi:hypothetical protein [Candidatus Avelusimicrobium facis]|uniref:hypothetical protein n=1 Tax=Candidatus Avelusimicrobium facis TaxID=3416203 RepID=UPI003D0FF3F4